MTNKPEPLSPGLEGWKPTFESGMRECFKSIDKDLMRLIGELKQSIAEFDSYRHAWAEIVANDAPPGRKSEFRSRLETMQGEALQMLTGWAIGIYLALYPERKERFQ